MASFQRGLRPVLRRKHTRGLAGLAASDVLGTVELFSPAHRHLSPARGAFLAAAPSLLANLHGAAGVVDSARWRALASASPSVQLVGALFHRYTPDEPPRASMLRSLPAAHLTPTLLGHVAGLAHARADDRAIEAALRAHCEVAALARESGVTIARFVRLAELARDAAHEGADDDAHALAAALGARPGHAILARLLWELARGRGCLLEYAAGVATHVPDALSPAGRAALEPGSEARAAFLRRESPAVAAAPPTAATVARRAADGAAACAAPSAAEVEALGAALLARVSSKPVVAQGRYGFRGQPSRPDCVEACVRELIEVLLYRPRRADFDLRRLPPAACARLRAFFERADPHAFAGADLSADAVGGHHALRERGATELDVDGGAAWFELCAARPGARYLSGGGGSARYELAPELSTVAAVSAHLLGLGDGCESVADLAARWNRASPRGPRLGAWATHSTLAVTEVAWFELLPPPPPPPEAASPAASPAAAALDAVDDAVVGGASVVIAMRPNSNHAFARRPPPPLSAELRALREALLSGVEAGEGMPADSEWRWALGALASGELLPRLAAAARVPPHTHTGPCAALASGELLPRLAASSTARAARADARAQQRVVESDAAARILWSELVHARPRLLALRAAARARGRACVALAPFLIEPLAAERSARLSAAVARALLAAGWTARGDAAGAAPAVREAALRHPLLALTLALLARDRALLGEAWGRARRDGESFWGAAGLLISAIGVAWVPDD